MHGQEPPEIKIVLVSDIVKIQRKGLKDRSIMALGDYLPIEEMGKND